MAWSARFWFFSFFAALNLVAIGCGPKWPQVTAQADRQFMATKGNIHTIDIMPMDVQLWTHRGNKKSPEKLGNDFHSWASGATLNELSRRGYQVVAQMQWSGHYDGRHPHQPLVMSPQDIEATSSSLSSYGAAVHMSNNQLVPPFLPARLGQQTGSDATLYVGGWSYVGKDGGGTAKKIAKGIGITLLVVAAVALVVIIVASKGEAAKGLGKLFGGAGRAAAGVARAAGRIAITAGRVAGRATGGILRGIARNGPNLMRGTLRTLDAFGRSNTHIHINNNYSGRPNYYKRDNSPRKGRSQMYLEMTLVDNQTGLVLWHARQRMPANASKSDHVRKAVSRLMGSLPNA